MECADVCCDTSRLIRILNQLELGLEGGLLLTLVIQDQEPGCEYYSGVCKPGINVSAACQNRSLLCIWWLQSQQSRLDYFSHQREFCVMLSSNGAEVRDV